MKVVEQLRETHSRYDVVWKGRTVRLEIDPCECGVHAKWVMHEKLRDSLPPDIVRAVENGNIQVMGPALDTEMRKVIDQWHWEPRWWERLLLRTMEGELRRWIRRTHLGLQLVARGGGQIDGIRRRLESDPV